MAAKVETIKREEKENKPSKRSKNEKGNDAAGRLVKRLAIAAILSIVLVAAIWGAFYYLGYTSSYVYVENSEILAPMISLAPVTPGILDAVYVHPGDTVTKDMIVARVSGNPVRAKTDGMVVSTDDVPGQVVSAQNPPVQMIEPDKLQVVGRLKENKGLTDIHPGQRVMFTVDAFSDQKFYGTVARISEVPKSTNTLFDISNNRPEKEYYIYVNYDLLNYTNFREGMSAKMYIYK